MILIQDQLTVFVSCVCVQFVFSTDGNSLKQEYQGVQLRSTEDLCGLTHLRFIVRLCAALLPSALSSTRSGNSCSTCWISLFIPDVIATVAGWGLAEHRSSSEYEWQEQPVQVRSQTSVKGCRQTGNAATSVWRAPTLRQRPLYTFHVLLFWRQTCLPLRRI